MRSFGTIGLSVLMMFAACTFSTNYKGSRFLCDAQKLCPENFTCTNGICVISSCSQDSDCPAGQACSNSKCSASDAGPNPDARPTCASNEQCGVGGYCIDKTCYQGASGDRCEQTVQCQTNNICEKVGEQRQCLRQCTKHSDCQLQQTCRPSLTGGDSLCVPRCDPIAQTGCKNSESCILIRGRGYCQTKKGAKVKGQLCKDDAECELHLYCRGVKDHSGIKRCTGVCDSRQQTGCTTGQQCKVLGPEEAPFGFCEPLPTQVDRGDICGGDRVCKAGLQCLPDQGLNRCQ